MRGERSYPGSLWKHSMAFASQILVVISSSKARARLHPLSLSDQASRSGSSQLLLRIIFLIFWLNKLASTTTTTSSVCVYLMFIQRIVYQCWRVGSSFSSCIILTAIFFGGYIFGKTLLMTCIWILTVRISVNHTNLSSCIIKFSFPFWWLDGNNLFRITHSDFLFVFPAM